MGSECTQSYLRIGRGYFEPLRTQSSFPRTLFLFFSSNRIFTHIHQRFPYE